MNHEARNIIRNTNLLVLEFSGRPQQPHHMFLFPLPQSLATLDKLYSLNTIKRNVEHFISPLEVGSDEHERFLASCNVTWPYQCPHRTCVSPSPTMSGPSRHFSDAFLSDDYDIPYSNTSHISHSDFNLLNHSVHSRASEVSFLFFYATCL
jgi:hypothetical protein